MRVLLHICCGPCLLEPFDALAADHEVELVYANPNIHPADEYHHRLDTLLSHARATGIPVTEIPYEPDVWDEAVSGLEDDPTARCEACFELRLTMAARHAAAEGFDAIATTLTVSPYQDAAAIQRAGEAAAAEAGITYLHRDFTDRYPQATRRSRELGMYRQNYCGCRYSAIEAQRQREERRAAKRREAALLPESTGKA
ncbi:MAG: epoxyqueuosine reductase QueH [Coriobacteriia bacterium]|nr:epoxyqueuosine reductase QueH [Coriobacteriia bacterium]